jgi:DNA-directed RNA polymerase beta' subunit
VEAAELYEKGKSKAGGLSDPRMGTMDKFGGICTTDGAGMHDCPGYFGHIELAEPVYHCRWLAQQAGAAAAVDVVVAAAVDAAAACIGCSST